MEHREKKYQNTTKEYYELFKDNTWRTLGTAYLGVVFETFYLAKILATKKIYGILEYLNVDILKEGFSEGALRKTAGLPDYKRPATMACK